MPHARGLGDCAGGDAGGMGLGDEELGLAVVEDVRQLLGLGLRVHEREGAPGDQRPEDRRRALRGVVEIESDALALFEAGVLQSPREPERVVKELPVRPGRVLVDDRVLAGARRAGVEHAVVDEPLRRARHQATCATACAWTVSPTTTRPGTTGAGSRGAAMSCWGRRVVERMPTSAISSVSDTPLPSVARNFAATRSTAFGSKSPLSATAAGRRISST